MEKWHELKGWLWNDVGRIDNRRDEGCETIRVAAILAKMADLEHKEGRLRRQEFDEPFDGEH